MKIEEAKKKVEYYQNGTGWVTSEFIIDILDQLDQPKPVVPQDVDTWFKSTDDPLNDYINLVETMHKYDGKNPNYNYDTGMYKWIKETPNSMQIVVNMYQFGYEVEKEKLYQIIDKRLNATFSCLGYEIDDRVWFWGNKKFFLKNKGARLAHTRQQLIDAGFEEVFENPNYEAKEVTE